MKHFFDIGANIGQTLDDYILPRVSEFDGWEIFCFEPSVRHLGELRDRCEQLASRHNLTINLCSFGLYDRTGWLKLHEARDPLADSFFASPGVRKSKLTVLCPVVDVVDFILANVQHPDTVTVKIDAEGSEFPILERILGAPDIWRNIERVLVEWHSTGPDSDDRRHRIEDRLKLVNIPLEEWTY